MDLGFERAGMQCKFQVEIDPFCRRVLAKHWPDVRRHDDVRTFPPDNSDDWRVDVLAGGFPCQDISNAGQKTGINGERSGLWREFARVIRVLRPSYVVIENVAAVTHRGLSRILPDLAGSGFDAEWQTLPAFAFGLPHRRRRTFIVAYAYGDREPESDQWAQRPEIFPSRWDYFGGLDLAQRRSIQAASVFRHVVKWLAKRRKAAKKAGKAAAEERQLNLESEEP